MNFLGLARRDAASGRTERQPVARGFNPEPLDVGIAAGRAWD